MGGKAAYKLLFYKVLQFLISTLHNFQLLPQDFADSLASHLSATVTSLLFLIVLSKMFFFGTLECVTPAEWPESWEKSSEAFCYSDGAYTVPHALANRTDGSEWSVKIRLDYYYWIPYIIVGQSIILKTPDFFWHYICGLHPKMPTETLKAFAYMVGHLEVVGHKAKPESVYNFTTCIARQRWSDILSKKLMSRNALVNFDSWDLFALYMTFKGLRLVALLLSLLYLKAAFGLDSILFGATMARNSLRGSPSEVTDLFPRWAFCDVRVRLFGQWITHSIQCALPINLLAEKALLFMWFWVVCCAVVLLFSAAVWCVKMLPSRREDFGRAYLAISEVARKCPEGRRKVEASEFLVTQFAAVDRAFMLRLVEERLGLAAVYLAMDNMAEKQMTNEV